MKRKNIFLIALLLLTMLFQPIVINADVSKAVIYLKSQPQDPWITQALVAAGEDNVPTDHLTQVSGNLATDYAKTILALASAGKNPKTFGNIDYVQKLKTYFNNNQIGDAGLINDDMWSVLALASVKENNSAEVTAAKNFILSNQNADGGWGYAVGGDSDTNDTATAVMALIEAGVNISNSAIINAIAYLHSAQNTDGGFSWSIGGDSDSGSDAWVLSALYKIGQNPADWNKNGNNPITHLETLEDTDGGFWWVKPGTSDFNNKAMTAYAVIALSGKSFPVGYYNNQTGDYHLRIEGQNGNICDTYISGATALDATKNASSKCNYSYVITESSFGSYLSQINNEAAAGMSGWMYFMNNVAPMVGAGDYALNAGDNILWYYGGWGWQPTRLSVNNNNPDSGGSITAKVEYFNGQSWLNLEGAAIKGGGQDYLTNSAGEAIMTLADGYYVFYAEKNNFVRSNKEAVTFGQQAVPQNINLTVEIDQGGGAQVAGEAIIFEVTPDDINFGKMNPGNAGTQTLNLVNSGTVNLKVSASITGNSLFIDNLKLNNNIWSDYSSSLAVNETKEAQASLSVPANYLQSGVKTGELYFWAQAQ
jgi:hypothetical protein